MQGGQESVACARQIRSQGHRRHHTQIPCPNDEKLEELAQHALKDCVGAVRLAPIGVRERKKRGHDVMLADLFDEGGGLL